MIVAPNPMLGNILCLIGQVFLAGMFVYEEKILKEYDVNLCFNRLDPCAVCCRMGRNMGNNYFIDFFIIFLFYSR